MAVPLSAQVLETLDPGSDLPISAAWFHDLGLPLTPVPWIIVAASVPYVCDRIRDTMGHLWRRCQQVVNSRVHVCSNAAAVSADQQAALCAWMFHRECFGLFYVSLPHCPTPVAPGTDLRTASGSLALAEEQDHRDLRRHPPSTSPCCCECSHIPPSGVRSTLLTDPWSFRTKWKETLCFCPQSSTLLTHQ